jgi:hypothetical protein
MAGADQSGSLAEDLYFGAQDNGSFASIDLEASPPTWLNESCCDVHNVTASSTRVVYTICCYSGATRLFARGQGMIGGGVITPPTGQIIGFRYPDAIKQFGPDSYVVITLGGVFITTNIGANPIVWTQLGTTSTPIDASNVWVASSLGTPTFFIQVGNGNGLTADAIFRYVGTGPGSWQQITPPGNTGGFGAFTVDATDPLRLFAAHLRPNADPEMVLSRDGGVTWSNLPALDALMTGGGVFRYRNARGPASRGGGATVSFFGYPMPTLVAFDTIASNVLVAGGAESGVFLSLDGGSRWELITDPLNPGVSGTPHLPRPVFAYFDHEGVMLNSIFSPVILYLGTNGRGVWRFTRTTKIVVGDICRLNSCREPELGPGKITLVCAGDPEHCKFIDFIPKNCLIKFRCPGCREGFCPPFYHIFLDSVDVKTWDIALFSRKGDLVDHEVRKTRKGIVVSFQPSKDLYREGKIGEYSLAFVMRPGGKPGRYVIPTHLEVSDGPLGSQDTKQIPKTP